MYPSYVSSPNDEFDKGQVYLEQFTFFQTVNFICNYFILFCVLQDYLVFQLPFQNKVTPAGRSDLKNISICSDLFALWVQQSANRQNILNSMYTHIFCSQIENFSSANDRTYEILFGDQISCKSCCPLSQ